MTAMAPLQRRGYGIFVKESGVLVATGVRYSDRYLDAMAAAPELLAACQAARDSLAHVDCEEDVCRKLDAAIAKARGDIS